MDNVTVRLDTWATVVITVLAATNILLLVGMAILGSKLAAAVKELAGTARETVNPSLEAVGRLAAQASDILTDVRQTVQVVAREGETTVTDVSRKVRQTAGLVSHVVSQPAITAESVMHGLSAGVSTLLAREDSTRDTAHPPGSGEAQAGKADS